MEQQLFTSFRYVVGNSFVFKDERRVKVFFIYKYKNIVLPLMIKKTKSHEDEQYYIDEAEKIINQKIKNGSLEEYAKKYVRKTLIKQTIKFSSISLASACAVAGTSLGIYFGIKLNIIHKFTFTGDCCKINDSYSFTSNIHEVDNNV